MIWNVNNFFYIKENLPPKCSDLIKNRKSLMCMIIIHYAFEKYIHF